MARSGAFQRGWLRVLWSAALVGVSACQSGADRVSPDSTSEVNGPLLLSGSTWPGRSVPLCWNSTFTTLPDFDVWSSHAHAALARSWTQATGLSFIDLGSCPNTIPGVINIGRQQAGNPGTSLVGYPGPSGATLMLLIPLDNFFVPFDAVAMHEFGHALGFAHEFARPDFTAPPETCPNVDINDEFHAGSGDTLDTPPDVQSILVSGYCGPIPEISYWDVVGSQHAYGFPNYFSDTDGDGRTDAIVVDPTAIRVKTSNGAQF